MNPLPRCAALDVLIKEIKMSLRPDAGLAGLLAALHQVRARADLLRSHLQFLLTDPEQLADASERAYWHVNGFLKLRLAWDQDFCLRLHIWPAGPGRRGDTEPHSHRWDFASWVAVGEGLRETYFTNVGPDDTREPQYVQYEYSRQEGERPLLRGTGVTRLRAAAPQERPINTVYDCDRHFIHTVAPVGDHLLATVLVQGLDVAESTAVYRPYLHHEFPVLERSIFPEEFGDLLRKVWSALQA